MHTSQESARVTSVFWITALSAAMLAFTAPVRAGCPCSADIAGGGVGGCEPNGTLSLVDSFEMAQCMEGNSKCDPQSLNCDVNCDGQFDLADFSAFNCVIDGGEPATCCSDAILGACCLSNGSCEAASQQVCELVDSIAYEPFATCEEITCPLSGQPIPAMSEWGVLILALGMAGTGTLVLRQRVRTAE